MTNACMLQKWGPFKYLSVYTCFDNSLPGTPVPEDVCFQKLLFCHTAPSCACSYWTGETTMGAAAWFQFIMLNGDWRHSKIKCGSQVCWKFTCFGAYVGRLGSGEDNHRSKMDVREGLLPGHSGPRCVDLICKNTLSLSLETIGTVHLLGGSAPKEHL